MKNITLICLIFLGNVFPTCDEDEEIAEDYVFDLNIWAEADLAKQLITSLEYEGSFNPERYLDEVPFEVCQVLGELIESSPNFPQLVLPNIRLSSIYQDITGAIPFRERQKWNEFQFIIPTGSYSWSRSQNEFIYEEDIPFGLKINFPHNSSSNNWEAVFRIVRTQINSNPKSDMLFNQNSNLEIILSNSDTNEQFQLILNFSKLNDPTLDFFNFGIGVYHLPLEKEESFSIGYDITNGHFSSQTDLEKKGFNISNKFRSENNEDGVGSKDSRGGNGGIWNYTDDNSNNDFFWYFGCKQCPEIYDYKDLSVYLVLSIDPSTQEIYDNYRIVGQLIHSIDGDHQIQFIDGSRESFPLAEQIFESIKVQF